MKKEFFITFIMACAFIDVLGQYNETIRSGRPGQSIGPFTVGKSVLQNQTGFQYGELQTTGNKQTEQSAVSVFRIGLTEQFELGAGISYKSIDHTSGDHKSTLNGINALSIRARSNIMTGKGLVPSIGWQLNLGIPNVSDNFKQRNVYPKVTVMTGQKLSDKFSFVTNSGLNWTGSTSEPTGFYTLNLGFSASNHLGFFAEHYGAFDESSWTPRWDAGLAYLINNDVQLDISGGYYCDNKINSEFFIDAGISWRIDWRK